MTKGTSAPAGLRFVLMLGAALLLAAPVNAADVPAATQKILKDLSKDPQLLAGLDRELAVPDSWIAGARKEGTFRLVGTWDNKQFQAMIKPFEERYPFIKVQFREAANRENRVIGTLVAFHAGRYLADVMEGISGGFNEFKQADAVANLSDMPGWNNVADGIKHPDGTWIGFRLRYWCMAYNTELVDKADLPAKWEDLLTTPRWRDNKIGLGNRPNLWLLNLWGQKGEAWARDYTTRLFSELKPQFRKEGLDALVGLVVAGEFQLSLPAGTEAVSSYMKRGAPVSWHCPEPVPAAATGILVMKGNPNINASKIFVNWLVSKEGQIARYAADGIPPAHKDLQSSDFVPFADQVAGKQVAFQDLHLIEDVLPEVFKFWNPAWGGDKREGR